MTARGGETPAMHLGAAIEIERTLAQPIAALERRLAEEMGDG